jgi:perosamine synthetase
LSRNNQIIDHIRSLFAQQEGFIGLHEPRFWGDEGKYVQDAINSTFVSSVGAYVNRFEEMMKEITGAAYAVAMVNGTTALQLSLELVGVRPGDEVITQPLTFVATANAIRHCGADPHFVDVDSDTLGLSPSILNTHLQEFVEMRDGVPFNRKTGKRIAACVPMHSFGLPLRIDEVVAVCQAFNIPVVEDAAESLGAYYKGSHTGRFGNIAAFSFNGNKIVTSGGGGAIITDDPKIGRRAKHLSTTAKIPHPWAFEHDEVAYNYRMPNLNAALACAQLEQLDLFVAKKRATAAHYQQFFEQLGIPFVTEIAQATSNYWLCSILLENREQRDLFLEETNRNKVMTRPAWTLMNKLPMYANCFTSSLDNAQYIEDRLVNLPSSVRSQVNQFHG